MYNDLKIYVPPEGFENLKFRDKFTKGKKILIIFSDSDDEFEGEVASIEGSFLNLSGGDQYSIYDIESIQFLPKKKPKSAAKGGGRKSPSSKKSKFRMQDRGKWQQIVIKAVKAKKSPSSLPDIKKWITNNYDYNTNNPKNWPKLNKAKRELVEEKILTKVKGKFKISTKPPSPQKKKPKSATKTGGGRKKQLTAKKADRMPPSPHLKVGDKVQIREELAAKGQILLDFEKPRVKKLAQSVVGIVKEIVNVNNRKKVIVDWQPTPASQIEFLAPQAHRSTTSTTRRGRRRRGNYTARSSSIFLHQPSILKKYEKSSKGGGRRKKSPSPRRVKAAQKIQKVFRKRRSPKKKSFKMQDVLPYGIFKKGMIVKLSKEGKKWYSTWLEKYGADGNPFIAEPEVSIENWEGIITRSDKDWTMPPFSRGKGLVIVKWDNGTGLSCQSGAGAGGADAQPIQAYRAGKGCSSEPCGEDERHNRYGFAPINFLVLKKKPKSAMKKGGGQKKRKSPKKIHKFKIGGTKKSKKKKKIIHS